MIAAYQGSGPESGGAEGFTGLGLEDPLAGGPPRVWIRWPVGRPGPPGGAGSGFRLVTATVEPKAEGQEKSSCGPSSCRGVKEKMAVFGIRSFCNSK